MSETDDALTCQECDWRGGIEDYALVEGRAVCPLCKGQLGHAGYNSEGSE
jgi:hypothetical protein